MNIYLQTMTLEQNRIFFRDFRNDPDICMNPEQFKPYIYSVEAADRYWHKQKTLGRVHLAVMLDEAVAGEILLKEITADSCVLSIHLQNDSVKNQGCGTAAEILALEYAFKELGLETVYADALDKNTRSRHVLEKVGFVEIRRDEAFHYYKCEKTSWNRPSYG